MVNSSLEIILEKFINSGWDFLEMPCKAFLNGEISKDKLIEVIKVAKEQCGSCGCEFDPLYDQSITLLSSLS